MPLTKFETIFCRPKPMPTPTAPLNTAKRGQVDADRIEADQQRHRNQCDPHEIAGQRPHRRAQRRKCWSLVSTIRARPSAIHSRMATTSTALMTSSNGEPQRADRDRQIVERRSWSAAEGP